MAKARNSISDKRPYKVYTALLTQSGTNAPISIELENSLGEVTYEYITVGTYKFVSDGLFKENKTNVYIANGSSTSNECVNNIFWDSENEIYIRTYLISPLGTLSLANGVLNLTSISIEVYN